MAVKSTSFDRNLGGRELDRLLCDHFANQFKEKYKIDIKSNPKAHFRLLSACEKTKKVLSANLQAPLNVECIMNDVDVAGTITREEFEKLAEPMTARVIKPLEEALKKAKISKEQIDSVEIIGGTSRVPSVKEKIKQFFNKELSTTLNADEAVSKGCAFQVKNRKEVGTMLPKIQIVRGRFLIKNGFFSFCFLLVCNIITCFQS